MVLEEMVKRVILENYEKTGQLYICPSYHHYKDWFLWDACFHAIICTELGMLDLAKNEIRLALKYQRPNGWIPHSFFLKKKGVKKLFGERLFYLKPSIHSNYSQPPFLAQAVEWINDPQFTAEVLPKILKFYEYFLIHQDPDNDLLINNYHPFETGNDSDPTFDRLLHRFRSKSEFLNWLSYFLSTIRLDWFYRLKKWNIEKIWQSNLFNIEYPLFITLWIDGLRSLARLSSDEKQKRAINQLADAAERVVYEKMWDKDAKIFRSLDSRNQQIKVTSAAHLVPLILDNIPREMIEGLVEHLTDKKEFWTDYPIPCVPRNSPYFNLSESKFACNWSGPVWVNINWLIIKGLAKHGQKYPFLLDIANTIAEKTMEMVKREGLWEYYHPFTGKGMRVKNFTSFSGLVVTFKKILSS